MNTVRQPTADCDTYEPVLCHQRQQLRSVDQASGEAIGRGRVGRFMLMLRQSQTERRTMNLLPTVVGFGDVARYDLNCGCASTCAEAEDAGCGDTSCDTPYRSDRLWLPSPVRR
jgi:hypothetical protein